MKATLEIECKNPEIIKKSQRERMRAEKLVFIPEWEMEVPIRKLKAFELVEATAKATGTNVELGKTTVDETMKGIYIILFAVKGFDSGHLELIENEPAGVVNQLLSAILMFSGFGDGRSDGFDNFEHEKKN